MSNIRTYRGVPPLSLFANGDGTPLVIDVLTDVAYYQDANVVRPLQPSPERVIVAYGGMRMTTPRAITLGAGWTRIDNYTASEFTDAVGVIEGLSAGSLEIANAGAYAFNFLASMTFTPLNAGRLFFVRLVNSISGVPVGEAFEMFVGRDAEGANAAYAFSLQAAGSDTPIAVELGGGDTFAAVSLRNVHYSVNRIG